MDGVAKCVKEYNYLTPVVHYFAKDKMRIVSIPEYGDLTSDAKKLMRTLTRSGLGFDAEWSFFAFEAWALFRTVEEGIPDGLMPSASPDRKSVVFVEYEQLDSRTLHGLAVIDDKTREFDRAEILRTLEDSKNFETLRAATGDVGWL